MNFPLAVFTPCIGVPSETFIRRHLQDLLPSKTVAVGGSIMKGAQGHWSIACPVLEWGHLNRTVEGILRSGGRQFGFPVADIASSAVKRFLRKHGVKVILGEYLDASVQWMKVAQDLGISFFGHAHGYDISRSLREKKWQGEYLRYNDESMGVITMSTASKSRLINLGLNESKIHVIPYGVDIARKPPERPSREIVRCLAVGRMVAKKAPILVLDSFRRAAERYSNMHLDYVGTGELLSAAQQYVKALGLAGKVILHKGQPNETVQRLMEEADIFLQHSVTDLETGDEEGLPVAILEAMAQSLPIVSTRHAGIPDAVIDGVTGYLVDEGDNLGMAERIQHLAQDHDLRCQMGMLGRQRAQLHFTWEKERSALLEVMGLDAYARSA